MTRHITNPETGRQIRVGGTLFCQLLFDKYDFISGELVRRAWAPETIRNYVYNVSTNRRILLGGRQYNAYIRAGWILNNENQLLHPNIAETNEIDRRNQSHIPIYEEIMNRHKERLANLGLSLCRECFCAIKIEEGEYCEEHKPLIE